jgi:hypothetical protein
VRTPDIDRAGEGSDRGGGELEEVGEGTPTGDEVDRYDSLMNDEW